MATSFLLIDAVVMSLFCTGTTSINLSNDDIDDSASLQQMKDINIDAVNDYLQEHEKRLATLRKHIEDYSEEHRKAIGKFARNLGVNNETRHGSSVDDFDKVESAQRKYDHLCRGEIPLSDKIRNKLKCRYIDRGILFLKIAPFKEEEAYLNPRIVLYHEVLYEEEIEVFKQLSEPRLKRAQVLNTTTGGSKDSEERIAKNGWLYDAENEHVKLLSRRVEHMTKLAVDTAEEFQIAYYEVGGLYWPHFDYIKTEDLHAIRYFTERRIGNRIATVLFYLNEVEGGGATVFTELDLTIWPKKGSALFWHNLKRNGETNSLTRHGACPVLSGTKWIATKWLHERGQEFIRPCSLSKNE